jgi:hypothetical protein
MIFLTSDGELGTRSEAILGEVREEDVEHLGTLGERLFPSGSIVEWRAEAHNRVNECFTDSRIKLKGSEVESLIKLGSGMKLRRDQSRARSNVAQNHVALPISKINVQKIT